MRKDEQSTRFRGRAANDNTPPRRRIVKELPADFPVTDTELEIVETYLAAIIARLGAGAETCSAANDNGAVSQFEI